MEGLTTYQIYFLTRDGEILRTLELDSTRDQDAIQKATHIRGADEVEIEVWERTRFVGWLAVPGAPRNSGHLAKNRPTDHPDRDEHGSRRSRNDPY